MKRRIEDSILEEGVKQKNDTHELIPYRMPIARLAATRTWEAFEANEGREDLIRARMAKEKTAKAGLLYRVAVGVLPTRLHKFVNYFDSLRSEKSAVELMKNVAVTACFSLFLLPTPRLNRLVQLYHAGLAASMTLLMNRNVPAKNNLLMPLPPSASTAWWSPSCMLSAAGITVFFGHFVAILVFMPVLAVFKWPLLVKIKLAMIISMWVNAYCSTGYECYESVSDNGLRWTKSKLAQQKEEAARIDIEADNNHLYDPDEELYAEKFDEEAEKAAVVTDIRDLLDKHFGVKPSRSEEKPISQSAVLGDKPDQLEETQVPTTDDTVQYEVGPFGFRDIMPKFLDSFYALPEKSPLEPTDFGVYRRTHRYSPDIELGPGDLDSTEFAPSEQEGTSLDEEEMNLVNLYGKQLVEDKEDMPFPEMWQNGDDRFQVSDDEEVEMDPNSPFEEEFFGDDGDD
jgi:hypothetical protein